MLQSTGEYDHVSESYRVLQRITENDKVLLNSSMRHRLYGLLHYKVPTVRPNVTEQKKRERALLCATYVRILPSTRGRDRILQSATKYE